MYRFLLNIYNKVFKTATFSESTVSKGSDSVIDFCCSPCQEHNIDQWAEFYCENCLKFYCGKCINLHGHLFGKHEMYGRGDTSKWPVPTEVKDFIQKCDLHEEQSIEMFCDDHSQLCCRKCVFLNHRQCAEVTLISELVKGPPPELQQLSRDIQSLHVELKKLQNNWDINIQSLKASYKKQLHEIGQTRQKINTILDEMEKTTMKELDARMTSLKASLKSDLDKIIKLKNETKQFGDAIHAIVDKGKEEIAFIASKKCLEKMKQSENFLKQNSVQIKSSLTFHADANVQQYLSKLSGLGKIAFVTKELVHLDDPDQVFTVQGKSSM
ncbi:tripartite motif-containing protein 66-like isoform X2 [Dreissena polymorpha]|uniref:tripartite motif-containing protein 66-like isoform X2 n=1 Tax=Dreissena polymorpha TaxID=45954 RepID=UPI002263FCDD|nr:tripartite motif-containing protein 66-like isoform X2 [Dreissena polymorpha]